MTCNNKFIIYAISRHERKQDIKNITENTSEIDVLSQLFETDFPFRQAYV